MNKTISFRPDERTTKELQALARGRNTSEVMREVIHKGYLQDLDARAVAASDSGAIPRTAPSWQSLRRRWTPWDCSDPSSGSGGHDQSQPRWTASAPISNLLSMPDHHRPLTYQLADA